MNKVFFFFWVIFLCKQGHAQSISSEAISSGGEMFTGTSSSLSFTTGELMSATHTNGGNRLMEGFQQQYYSYWTGKVSTAWNDLLNWKGGPVPGKSTDVIIPPGCTFYPLVSINAFCRSIKLQTGASLTVATGFNLTITH